MINTYQDFIDYFRNLAKNHTDIKDFVVGGSERILNRQNSEIEYPILWLEIPDINPKGSESLKLNFDSAFLVLKNAAIDDWDQEEADLHETLIIVVDILTRMVEDDDESIIEFDIDTANIEWKGKQTGDNDWGWRVPFRLRGYAESSCVNSDKWLDKS